MAEKKNTVSASESTRKKRPVAAEGGKNTITAKPKGNATGRRIGAVVLWVVAIAFEILAILVLFKKIDFPFDFDPIVFFIIFIVLDLICVIIGAMLWKQANHIDPKSEKNKTLFWIWNNMGLIVAIAAFVPLIVLTLTNKKADKKTKIVGAVVGCIALLIGGLCAYDWNPLSAEMKAEQEGIYADSVLPEKSVYFTQTGKKYHLYRNCSHIVNRETVYEAIAGSDSNEGKSCVDVALENGCNDVCADCKKRFEEEVGLDAAKKLEEEKKKEEEEKKEE